PLTMEIVWQYAGTTDHPLHSAIRGDQQRLANGNTLIAESDSGRILEITGDGSRVWEFFNPARGGSQGDRIAIVNHAQRIPEADAQWALPATAALSATSDHQPNEVDR